MDTDAGQDELALRRRPAPPATPTTRRDVARWTAAVVLAAAVHLSPILLVLPLSKVPELETAKAIEVELVPPPKPRPAPKPAQKAEAKPPAKPAPEKKPAPEPEKKAVKPAKPPEPPKQAEKKPEAEKKAPEKKAEKKPDAEAKKPSRPVEKAKLPEPAKPPEKKVEKEPGPDKKKPEAAARPKPTKSPKQTARVPKVSKKTKQAGKGGQDPVASWLFVVRQKLRRAKRYPDEARAVGLQGRVAVSFIIDKNGKVVDFWIAKSSGSRVLDHAAASALVRALPFPKMPREMKRDSIKLTYAVDYFVR